MLWKIWKITAKKNRKMLNRNKREKSLGNVWIIDKDDAKESPFFQYFFQ